MGQRHVLAVALVMVLAGSVVAYAVAGSDSRSKGEGLPDPTQSAPVLEHYDKGEAIILESGSPEAR